jgi:lipopolysaccharide export system ATP-binding protein
VPILQARGLVKSYGRRLVVNGVDFEVHQAEIVGLLGPNGAGKTTCFKITCGMIDSDAGRIDLGGADVTNWPMYRRAREGGMGYLAQESSVFRKLSVEQNLLGVMEMLGVSRKRRRQRCDELLEQFGIARLRKSRALSLSGGERRRLEIARCLVSTPKIILLDEPFTGIDPVTIDSIQRIIRELRSQGIAILITDHQVRETLEITDRSYVIHDGQVLCHGPPADVLQNPTARKLYFGEGIALTGMPPAPHVAVAPARSGAVLTKGAPAPANSVPVKSAPAKPSPAKPAPASRAKPPKTAAVRNDLAPTSGEWIGE